MEYQRVAQQLLETVTPLYEQEQPDETQFFGLTPEPSARENRQSARQVGPRGHGQDSDRKSTPSQAGPTYPAPAQANTSTPSPSAQARTGLAGGYGAQPSHQMLDASLHASYTGELSELDDGLPTGLFAPQLPASPMDRHYPPRALPSREGAAGKDWEGHRNKEGQDWEGQDWEDHDWEDHDWEDHDWEDHDREEPTEAIAQMVPDDATIQSGGRQAGANIYKDAEAGDDSKSQSLRCDDSGMTPEEEAESDDFTLRLSLMRYANPLLCKVVLFSALHRLFRFSEQDWVELRHQGLASLMAELVERYPNLIDLEMKLCGVAEQLEVPEQAMQTVAALLKVLKPRYDAADQAPARNMGLALAAPAPAAPVAAKMSGPKPEMGENPTQDAAQELKTERATAIQFGPYDAKAHGEPIPGETVPGEAVPGETIPGELTHGESVPDKSVPDRSIPGELTHDTPAHDTPAHDKPAHDTPAITAQTPPSNSAPSDRTVISDRDVISDRAVIAEVLPSEKDSYEALISDDFEADLALLAASLEDDAPSLSNDS